MRSCSRFRLSQAFASENLSHSNSVTCLKFNTSYNNIICLGHKNDTAVVLFLSENFGTIYVFCPHKTYTSVGKWKCILNTALLLNHLTTK
jgi:hypothetical protein